MTAVTDAKTLQPIPVVTPDALVNELELAALAAGGTVSQRERHAAKLLPEEELLVIARAELFKAFDGIPRWHLSHQRREMLRELAGMHPVCRSKRGKTSIDNDPAIDSEVTELSEANDAQWQAMRAITTAASLTNQHSWLSRMGNCDVEFVTHWFTCRECKVEVSRSSAKVRINWAGRTLVREYSL